VIEPTFNHESSSVFCEDEPWNEQHASKSIMLPFGAIMADDDDDVTGIVPYQPLKALLQMAAYTEP